jgi:hypothetical protein
MRVFAAISALVLAVSCASGETRGPVPYTPQQLKDMSTLVFEGAVKEIETDSVYKVAFPTKAAVETVLKGKQDRKELTFAHKNPGRCLILEGEFNAPQVGQTGVFCIQEQAGILELIGYIKKTEAPASGLEKAVQQSLTNRPAGDTNSVYPEMREDLKILGHHDQHHFNASPDVMTAAKRVFDKIDFVGRTDEQVKGMLGEPFEITTRNQEKLWDYMFHNGEAGVCRRLVFAASGHEVKRVEQLMTE